jgi:hypothetical protein
MSQKIQNEMMQSYECRKNNFINMDWGFEEKRVALIALHKCGKSDSQIFKLLKPLKI